MPVCQLSCFPGRLNELSHVSSAKPSNQYTGLPALTDVMLVRADTESRHFIATNLFILHILHRTVLTLHHRLPHLLLLDIPSNQNVLFVFSPSPNMSPCPFNWPPVASIVTPTVFHLLQPGAHTGEDAILFQTHRLL